MQYVLCAVWRNCEATAAVQISHYDMSMSKRIQSSIYYIYVHAKKKKQSMVNALRTVKIKYRRIKMFFMSAYLATLVYVREKDRHREIELKHDRWMTTEFLSFFIRSFCFVSCLHLQWKSWMHAKKGFNRLKPPPRNKKKATNNPHYIANTCFYSHIIHVHLNNEQLRVCVCVFFASFYFWSS